MDKINNKFIELEAWFIFYLIGINLLISIFLFLDIKDASIYEKAIKKFEIRLSQ